MSWIKRLGGRLPDFEDVVRRFPVAVLVMAVATIWLIYAVHSYNFLDDEAYILSGFILAGYGAVIGRLIGEARGWSSVKSAVLSSVLAVPAFLICAFGEDLKFIVPLGIGSAILFLGNAAAWRQPRNDPSVWNFTQKLWTGAIFAAVGSVIFTAGMFIISEAVRALFGVSLEDVTIKTLLPIGLLFLAPVYWMGTLPRYGEAQEVAELSFEARALSFLGTWMLAPLVTIYALIILAYGAKVLVQWELPKGEIAQLVSPFLGVGMLVWLMLERKVLKEGAFVRVYRAAWHWIMLPAATLLGVAVFVRLREYGFTSLRFFLLTVVIWAILQSLWFIAGPKLKRDIRIPTALAAGLLMLGAFAAEPFSATSQFQRAEAAKAKLDDFSAEAIQANPDAAKRFLGSLKYLVRHDHEKPFQRLLPNKKFPSSLYGSEYEALIDALNLRVPTATENSSNKYVTFSLGPTVPVDLPKSAKLYVISDLNLYRSKPVNSQNEMVVSQNGPKVEVSIETEIYPIDFEKIFSDVEFVGGGEKNLKTLIPEISVTSDAGTDIRLLILDGNVRFKSGEFNGGTVTVAAIVPQ